MGVRIVKSLAGFMLLVNFCMYVTVAGIAGWAVNKAIDHHYVSGKWVTNIFHFGDC